jgi:alpha-mannosidase
VPALGYTVFFITVAKQQEPVHINPKEISDQIISNAVYDLTYENGNIKGVKNIRDNIQIDFERQVLAYTSYTGDDQPSGAYIMRTDSATAKPVNVTSKPVYVEGDVSHVIKQTLGNYVKEDIRLYKTTDKDSVSEIGEASVIEFNYAVGPLPQDTETIIRFNTNIKSNLEILTDSNGLQSYTRKYRDWPNDPANHLYPVASNFYPLVYHASIGDDQYQLTIVANTSRGVASMKEGSIEVLVHRRTSKDDRRGVATPLDDVQIVGIQLRVIIEKKVSKKFSFRDICRNLPLIIVLIKHFVQTSPLTHLYSQIWINKLLENTVNYSTQY